MLSERAAVCLHRSYGGLMRYFASSMASSDLAQSNATAAMYREGPPSPVMSEFDSTAFRHVSSSKLLGTILVLSACKVKPMVNRSEALLSFSKRVLGEKLTHGLMRKTFFAHFCGGETVEGITGTIEDLKKRGVGSILDYAAEKDVSSEPVEGEKDSCFEENLNCSLSAIHISTQQPKAYSAVKLTSIGSPNLLLAASAIVVAVQQLFTMFSEHAAGMAPQQQEARDVPSLRRSEFVSAAKEILNVFQDEAETVYSAIHDLGPSYVCDTVEGDSISIYGWTEYFSPQKFGSEDIDKWLLKTKPHESRSAALAQLGGGGGGGTLKALSAEDKIEWEKLCSRVARLGECAAGYPNARVMVDAEQTFLQPAIDLIVMREQHRSNGKRAVVYNTYQAYLKDSQSRLLADLKRGEHLNHRFGVKLVRGAYLVRERELSQRHGYADPINKDLASSHVSYDACVSMLLDNLDQVELLMGTHNENSILKAMNLLQQRGFQPEDAPVSFAQLLGMCDHVSLSLGKAGYSSFKYVPYGPVGEVLPYLLRRAQENSDLLGSSTKEMGLIAQELRRRVMESPLFTRFSAADSTHQSVSSASGAASTFESKEHLKGDAFLK
eukprot:GHVS01066271.1.p1 GENE.GHVS01066271.1~~GHVS01066271.1.p1  ORF type:complete len:608 (+),score=90.81 GHVS01066271.1:125-1948(+)